MKINKTTTGSIVGIGIAIVIAMYVLMYIIGEFPIPRGNKVNNNYYTYYKNIFGIYYISVEHAPALFNYGSWGYLDDVDIQTFKVLGEGWAKDANHVWHNDKIVKNTDVNSFHINQHGVAVDKDKVFIRDSSNEWGYIRPSHSGIDVETAEYFIYRLGELQDEWMRDKNFVYHYDQKIDVDRNSFEIYGEDWFIDNDFLYKTLYNDVTRKWDLHRIDSLQKPIEAGYQYFRNGRNIIYNDSIILKDIDVQRFEEIGVGKYRINNMLFLWGKPFLKDSLNVENARFYFHGHIAADNENVYYVHNLLDDIDASTFRQIDDETFEDKSYIYTIKEKTWGETYPFVKKKK
ncbi:MAG: hypothetical protein HDS11_08135 [Bacteroides sp.]|nr:hypothetical protein [Bacteroides sp.]